MKYRDLADIALKIFGIYWLVKAVTNIVQIVLVLPKLENMSAGRLDIADIIGWAFLVVLYAVLGFFLTFRTRMLIHAIKADESESTAMEATDSISTYRRLGLFLLGVFFIVPAVSSLMPQLIKLLSYKKIAPEFPNMYKDAFLVQEWPRLMESSIQFVFGFVLIIGKERLVTFWRRLRPLSTTEDNEERD